MKILIIPLDQVNYPRANVRLTPLIKEFAKNHQLLGVKRVPYFNTQNEFLKHFKFLIYFFKVFYYGLQYRKKIDLILGEGPPFGLIGAILSVILRKPFIWDTHDGNLLTHYQLLKTSNIYTRLSLFCENFVGYVAKAIIVPSELDKYLYSEQKYKYRNKIKVIPSGIDLSHIEAIKEDRITLRKTMMVDPERKVLISGGNRDYLPANEGVLWINNELAPVLTDKFKDTQIVITGLSEIPENVHPIVRFAGYVQDYYQHILASDVCLVPYNMNTGISTKLIDYLACGRPTVTTLEVARLFPQLIDGQNIIVAKDRKEFIEKTIAILNNPKLGEKIGVNGREVIKKYHDVKVIKNMWQTLFETWAKDNFKKGV